MSLRQEKLERVKAELIARKKSVLDGLKQATAELLHEEVFFADSVDQASAAVDRAVLMQMRNRDSNVLLELDEAIRRIEDGVFGDCERCGDEISEARMKARPSATLCIGCQAEVESEESRYLNRLNAL